MQQLNVFDVPQMAEVANVAPRKVIRWIDSGKLQRVPININGRPRYLVEESVFKSFVRDPNHAHDTTE